MSKLTCTRFVIAFSAIFLSNSAFSTAIPDRGPIPFATYDENGDGLISKKEFSNIRKKRILMQTTKNRPMKGNQNAPSFTVFDTNNDGSLTQEELAMGQKIQMEKRLSMKQGRRGEKGMGMSRNMPSFSTFDLNSDGTIVEDEFNNARSSRISERAKQGYRMKNIANAPSFTDIDVNGDGKISKKEFLAHQTLNRQK